MITRLVSPFAMAALGFALFTGLPGHTAPTADDCARLAGTANACIADVQLPTL